MSEIAIIFDERGLPITSTNPFPVAISGSNGEQDLRGLAADKPAATVVIVGTTYWSVDTGAIEVSDGANWVPV